MSKYDRARSLLGQLSDEEQTVFGGQLKHAVSLGNPLAIRTFRQRTICSGLRGGEMPKESKVLSIPFTILFPVLTHPYHHCRFIYTYSPIRLSLQHASWHTFLTFTSPQHLHVCCGAGVLSGTLCSFCTFFGSHLATPNLF